MLRVTRKRGISLVNSIPCKSDLHSFSFSAFGPKGHNAQKGNSLSNCRCLCPSLGCLCCSQRGGEAVLPAREAIMALKLVGRLVYRLTFCGCIFMVQNPKYLLYNRMCEREMIKWHDPAHHPHGNCITKKSYRQCKGKMLFSLMQNIAFEICKLGRGSEELFLPPALCLGSFLFSFLLTFSPSLRLAKEKGRLFF